MAFRPGRTIPSAAALALGLIVASAAVVVVEPAAGAGGSRSGTVAVMSSNFQQDQRINSLTMQFVTDSFATHNALGGAIAPAGQANVQSSISAGVTNGATSLLMEFPGISDLTGTNVASLSMGTLGGSPIEPAGNPATYDGNSDLDWWYAPNPTEIDSTGKPVDQMTGSITSHALIASAGAINLDLNEAGLGTQLLSSVQLVASTGASSAPLKSNGFPPGHLPIEKVPATLQSFASMSTGRIKGNVSAGTLATTSLPSSITSTCTAFTSANSWLDLLVHGCLAFGAVTVINATQPDEVTPGHTNGPYTFTENSSLHVTGCTNKFGPAPLSTCLANAAYSAYFTFSADRVIVHNPNVPAISVSPGSGAHGSAVTISGTSFVPGGTIHASWLTGITATPKVSLCSTVVASDKTFSCNATVPTTDAGALGAHLVLVKESPKTKKAMAEGGYDLTS
jgi:hypothetical protein